MVKISTHAEMKWIPTRHHTHTNHDFLSFGMPLNQRIHKTNFLSQILSLIYQQEERHHHITMGDCFQEANIYNTFVQISFAVTIANIMIALKYQENFFENPNMGMKYYFVVAAVKTFLGLLLLTFLYPADCAGASPVYGVIVLVIGLGWFLRGMKYKKLRDAGNNHTELAPAATEMT